MNYELAKQLKDAGFPQAQGDGSYLRCPCWVEGCKDKAYIPSLSELIEACGNKILFWGLELNKK